MCDTMQVVTEIRDPAAPPGTFRDPVFGDLTRIDEMRGNFVKGNLMQSRIWYVRDRFGEQALDEIQAAIPSHAREIIKNPPMSFAWCSFGDMMDIDRAILEGPMRGDMTLMREFGGAIATHDLPALYRVLFKVGTPGFVLKRVGIVAATYVKESPMKGEGAGDNRVVISQTGRTYPYYFCAYGVSGWFEAAVRLSGGRNITVTHDQCRHRGAAACHWDARWS